MADHLLLAAGRDPHIQPGAGQPRDDGMADEEIIDMQPYLPPDSSEGERTPFVRQLLYLDVKVDGDQAEIKFDTGAKNQRALLVRIDGRWYVAGIF